VKAGQDRERQKNEGQAYANDVVPKARGAAFRLIQEAEAYRAMTVQNATGNADRFKSVLAEYQKAPAVTRDRMYLDTMQQIFSNTSKVMVDSKAGSNLLYLPLDKLIAQVAATEARAATVSGAPPTAVLLPPEPTPDPNRRDGRSRESSRDREGR
jgi:membrane protease subunit HflK